MSDEIEVLEERILAARVAVRKKKPNHPLLYTGTIDLFRTEEFNARYKGNIIQKLHAYATDLEQYTELRQQLQTV